MTAAQCRDSDMMIVWFMPAVQCRDLDILTIVVERSAKKDKRRKMYYPWSPVLFVFEFELLPAFSSF